jgi:hypothetical protein
MLSLSPYVYYLSELFNPDDKRLGNDLIPLHFRYVPKHADEPMLKMAIGQILDLNFHWSHRSGLRRYFPNSLHLFRQTRKAFGLPRPLLKDPIAVFSSAWLAKEFQMQVLCLVRHPAAFVFSLQKAGWPADFGQFLCQPKLMEDWLHDYADRFQRPSENYVKRAALLWLAIYDVLSQYCKQHPDWLVMRLEDIVNEPLEKFSQIYDFIGLPYTSGIRSKIISYSSDCNPTEAPKDDLHLIKRNSKASQNVWKSGFTQRDVRMIREITEPISSIYYSDKDWSLIV